MSGIVFIYLLIWAINIKRKFNATGPECQQISRRKAGTLIGCFHK